MTFGFYQLDGNKMGNTWEANAWKRRSDKPDEYHYIQVYAGESFVLALWNMWKCKRSGDGCVKLEWR